MAGRDCSWGWLWLGGDLGRRPLLLRDWGPGTHQSLGARSEEMEECTSSIEESVNLFLLVPVQPPNCSSSWPQSLVCVMIMRSKLAKRHPGKRVPDMSE